MPEAQHQKDFAQFDKNGDGFVDAQEMREILPDISNLAISTFFIESDKNEDGKVSFHEYMHA